MNLYEDREGGMVVVKALTYVGPIRPVKVSKGKGKDLVETTVYNFMMKGGFQVFQSVDYGTEDEAIRVWDEITSIL